MLNIGPINSSNYRMVKTNKKVTPVSGVNSVSNNRSNNNSSNFSDSLEEEINKLKKKSKKNG